MADINTLIASQRPPNILGQFVGGVQAGQQIGQANQESQQRNRLNQLLAQGASPTQLAQGGFVDQASSLLKVRSGLQKAEKDEFDSGMRSLAAFTEGITDATDPNFATQLQAAQNAGIGIDADDVQQALKLGPQVIQRLSRAGGKVNLSQVQSSKILPGGLTQITRKDGRTEIVRLNEKDSAEVRKAEERGVTLQTARAKGRETGRLGAQLDLKPEIEAKVTSARAIAADRGEVFTELNQMKAALPSLQSTVAALRELAPIATSTLGGSVFDTVVKESGFGSTTGATAKAKFIAIINNQVLPLLKPTFGAAFTVQEGESLKATMGDPTATPAEKMAQLDAFIDQKIRDIETKEAQLQQPVGAPQQVQVMRFDEQGNLIQ